MALINCPECGKEISDKVKACPHCGYPLVEESIDPSIPKPQQVEVTGVRIDKNKSKKIIIYVAGFLVLALIGFFLFKYLSEQKAQKEYETSFNNYIDQLLLFRVASISGAADSESLSNLIAKVWANSIYEERDPETDKYTRPDGYFVDDFNDALSELFSDYSTRAKISDIEENQESVKNLMKELQNPPEGLQQCFDTASELYSAYLKYTNLAINPTGSLSTFNQTRNKISQDFLDAYNRLDSQIPDKFEENIKETLN